MQEVSTFHQHEGKAITVVQEDESEAPVDFQSVSCESVLNREEMKRYDLKAIQQKVIEFANQIGQAQTQQLIEAAGEAADSVFTPILGPDPARLGKATRGKAIVVEHKAGPGSFER